MLPAKSQKFVGPIYLQVYDILKSDLLNDTWPVGRILPSEVDLAKMYGVSVGTMRKSLGLLVEEGYIVRQRGRGTVVADRSNRRARALAGKLVSDRHAPPLSPLSIETETRPATLEEAKALELDPSSKVHAIVRSVLCRDAYRYVETLVIPRSIMPTLPAHLPENLDEDDTSIIWSHHPQPPISSVEERILPTKADAELARELEVVQGETVLRVARIAYGSDRQPIEYSIKYMHLVDAEYAVQFEKCRPNG